MGRSGALAAVALLLCGLRRRRREIHRQGHALSVPSPPARRSR
jgi:hypothetical protein